MDTLLLQHGLSINITHHHYEHTLITLSRAHISPEIRSSGEPKQAAAAILRLAQR